jgi:hypothetical protein
MTWKNEAHELLHISTFPLFSQLINRVEVTRFPNNTPKVPKFGSGQLIASNQSPPNKRRTHFHFHIQITKKNKRRRNNKKYSWPSLYSKMFRILGRMENSNILPGILYIQEANLISWMHSNGFVRLWFICESYYNLNRQLDAFIRLSNFEISFAPRTDFDWTTLDLITSTMWCRCHQIERDGRGSVGTWVQNSSVSYQPRCRRVGRPTLKV